MSPRQRTANGKGLTVAKSKAAVLLRLPKTAVSAIDKMAKKRKGADGKGLSRTAVIYRILAAHPKLAKQMEGVL